MADTYHIDEDVRDDLYANTTPKSKNHVNESLCENDRI